MLLQHLNSTWTCSFAAGPKNMNKKRRSEQKGEQNALKDVDSPTKVKQKLQKAWKRRSRQKHKQKDQWDKSFPSIHLGHRRDVVLLFKAKESFRREKYS